MKGPSQRYFQHSQKMHDRARQQHEQFRKRHHDRFKKRQQDANQNAVYLRLQELERFRQVRARARELQAMLPNGRLTENQLAELLVKDNAGVIWMAGLDGQSWYRRVGNDWVAATPASLLPASADRMDDIGKIILLLPILIFIGWVLYRLFVGS